VPLTAVDVTLPPAVSDNVLGAPPNVNLEAFPVEPLFKNSMLSTRTAPTLLLLVVREGSPVKRNDHVPLVVGVVLQLPLDDQLLLVPLPPSHVVIVPADAVPATAMLSKANIVSRKACEFMTAESCEVAITVCFNKSQRMRRNLPESGETDQAFGAG